MMIIIIIIIIMRLIIIIRVMIMIIMGRNTIRVEIENIIFSIFFKLLKNICILDWMQYLPMNKILLVLIFNDNFQLN